MRGEDFDVGKLQHYRLIQRVLCVKNNLMVSDWDLLIYLNQIKLFNQHDFKDGTMTMSWDRGRFQRLVREGWLKKVHDGRGWNSGHTKYTVSQKTKMMLNKLAKIIDGKEDLPDIKNPKGYKQKLLCLSIRKFNNLKYKDYEN